MREHTDDSTCTTNILMELLDYYQRLTAATRSRDRKYRYRQKLRALEDALEQLEQLERQAGAGGRKT